MAVATEKVEVLTVVRVGKGSGTEAEINTHGPGEVIEVPVKDVHGLVMAEAVKRLSDANSTDDEKIREARVKVTQLEDKAIELQKKASDAMVQAITLGGDKAQEKVQNEQVAAANVAKAEAVKAVEALAKLEAAAADKAAKKAAGVVDKPVSVHGAPAKPNP